MIRIELPGEPRGKGRPRSRVAWTKSDKPFVAVYTDAETRKYETALAWAAKAAMRGHSPLMGPLAVTVRAFFTVPKSWTIKKRDAALTDVVRPTGAPDCDNIAKMIDALNGIVWRDDSQIVEIEITKRYGERAVLFVEVDELEVWTMETDQNRQMSLV